MSNGNSTELRPIWSVIVSDLKNWMTSEQKSDMLITIIIIIVIIIIIIIYYYNSCDLFHYHYYNYHCSKSILF